MKKCVCMRIHTHTHTHIYNAFIKMFLQICEHTMHDGLHLKKNTPACLLGMNLRLYMHMYTHTHTHMNIFGASLTVDLEFLAHVAKVDDTGNTCLHHAHNIHTYTHTHRYIYIYI